MPATDDEPVEHVARPARRDGRRRDTRRRCLASRRAAGRGRCCSSASRTDGRWPPRRCCPIRRGSPAMASPSSSRTVAVEATRRGLTTVRRRRARTVRRPSNGRPRLPFCDGRVATYGFSYQGLAQLYAAARRPPSLRGIAAMMCCPDPYEGWTYEGGCLRLPFVAFWSAQLAGQELGSGPDRLRRRALPVGAALGDDPPPWFTEWLAHPSDDDVLGGERRPDLAMIDVPGVHRARLLRRLLVGHGPDDRRARRGGGVRAVDAHALGIPPRRCELGDEASPAVVSERLVAFFDRVFDRDATACRRASA